MEKLVAFSEDTRKHLGIDPRWMKLYYEFDPVRWAWYGTYLGVLEGEIKKSKSRWYKLRCLCRWLSGMYKEN